MKLTISMPWERNLSVNHCRMGPQGNWHIKPDVEAWMRTLAWRLKVERWAWDGSLPIGVVVDFRFPNKRKIDDHNYYYVITNSVADGLGIDDRHIRISTGSVAVDRDNPGFKISVTDETEA